MRDVTDNLTLPLPGIPILLNRGRGRPVSPDSLSAAERQRRFRKNHAVVKSSGQILKTITTLATEFNLSQGEVTQELLRFALCNKNWRKFGFPATKK